MGLFDTIWETVKVAAPVVMDALSSDKKDTGAGHTAKVDAPDANLTAGKKVKSTESRSSDSDSLGSLVELVSSFAQDAKLTKDKAQAKITKAFGDDDHCDLQEQAATAIANAFKGGLNADEKKQFTALKKLIGDSMKEDGISKGEVEQINVAIGNLNKAAGVSR